MNRIIAVIERKSMIVGVCGLGYTGSGAVMDLMKEFRGIQIQDGDEFGILYRPDGLEDLAYHVLNKRSRYMSCDAAIYRFRELIRRSFGQRTSLGNGISSTVLRLTDEYIEDICQVTWSGTWGFDAANHSRAYNSFKGHIAMPLAKKIESKYNIDCYPYRKMYLSVAPELFIERTRKYVSDLILTMGYSDRGILVMNQLFSGDCPECGFQFINNPKAIVVDKDPRDLYFLGKFEVRDQCTWMPTNDVNSFIKYYRTIRKGIKDNDNVLRIRFEDLIYEYEITLSKIMAFIGVKREDHIHPKKYFNPDVSKNNTQLFIKYSDYKEDINKIETELSDWLFPYENYEKMTVFGRSF